jgi:hypothetical protein
MALEAALRDVLTGVESNGKQWPKKKVSPHDVA